MDQVLPPAGSLWQNYLLDRVITADNAFTRMAASGRLDRSEGPAELIKTAAAADLKMLRLILDIDYSGILPPGAGDCLHLELISRPLSGPEQDPAGNTPGAQIFALKKSLLATRDWEGSVELLWDFHSQCGFGVFARYHALRWDGRNKKPEGIAEPDPVRLENLYGHEHERMQVVQNTERLVSGLPSCSDTIQEKLSLSDRFGITVLFLSPDQDLYLKIVEHLAREKGIGIAGPELRSLALEWERWHNSRSGRTARQFVDQLTGSV